MSYNVLKCRFPIPLREVYGQNINKSLVIFFSLLHFSTPRALSRSFASLHSALKYVSIFLVPQKQRNAFSLTKETQKKIYSLAFQYFQMINEWNFVRSLFLLMIWMFVPQIFPPSNFIHTLIHMKHCFSFTKSLELLASLVLTWTLFIAR